MNKLTNGTEYRETLTGIIAIRGKRELYLLGTSVETMAKSREILSQHSFNRIFTSAAKSPASKNVAYLKVGA